MGLKENIRAARLGLEMTLDDVAKVVGVSRQTIQRYESGVIGNIPSDRLEKLAVALHTTPGSLMGWDDKHSANKPTSHGVKIPVLGTIVAGIPITAVENIIDYEEISQETAKTGEYFALVVKGSSMEPKIYEGDVVIVKKQSTVDNGDIAIVLVNGNEATIKQIQRSQSGITLVGFNVAVYPPHIYTNEEIEDLPVNVIGKAVEVRRKL